MICCFASSAEPRKRFAIPYAPPSRSPSPVAVGSSQRMPSVEVENSASRTVSDSPSDQWYCPYVPPESRKPFAFFPVSEDVKDAEIEAEEEETTVAALDPLDEPVFFPHVSVFSPPASAKRASVQTAFYQPK